ncbi:MAG TPA: hypothetical protein VIH99_14345 [Bdellovibrionota bacterium]|jgi:hypothetical protein
MLKARLPGPKPLPYIVLAGLLIAIFVHAALARTSTFGHSPGPGDNSWRLNSDFALVAARNWYFSGPWKLGFKSYVWHVRDRSDFLKPAYISYPPLYVAIPWLISVAKGTIPSTVLLHILAYAAQILSALLLAFWICRLAERAGTPTWAGVAHGLAAGAIWISLPVAMDFFQNIWWPDTLVLPLYLAALLAETAPYKRRAKKNFRLCFFALACLGVFSEWLFCFLLFALWFKRLTNRTEPGDKRLWPELLLPVLLVFCFQLAQVLSEPTGWEMLCFKLLQRTGISPHRGHLNLPAIFHYLGTYESWWVAAFLVSLPLILAAFLLRHRLAPRPRELSEAAFLLSAPLVLHLSLFREHYIDHAYTWLKFGLLSAFVPFALVPLALGCLANPRRIASFALATAALAASLLATRAHFAAHAANPTFYSNLPQVRQEQCDAFAQVPWKEDFFVSPNFGTFSSFRQFEKGHPEMTSEAAAACHRTIYWTPTLDRVHVYAHLMRWRESQRVSAVFMGSPPADWLPYLRKDTLRRTARLEIYELESGRFLK